MYVLKGILYFVAHPSLWLATVCPLVLMLAVSATAIILLFTMALGPQARGLMDAKVPSGLAWFLAVIFVLLESLIAVLAAVGIVLPGYTDHLFDRVMALRGHSLLLAGKNASSCCKSLTAACRVSVALKLGILIGSLPLHAIPFVGSVAWIALNGVVRGWEAHQRYFDLRGWGYARQKTFVRSRMSEYASFGMLALALELIPGLGFVFIFTNVVGAALFASDLELVISTRPVGQELAHLDHAHLDQLPHSAAHHHAPAPATRAQAPARGISTGEARGPPTGIHAQAHTQAMPAHVSPLQRAPPPAALQHLRATCTHP